MENKVCENGICNVNEDLKAAAQKLEGSEVVVSKEKLSVFMFGKKDCPLCKETKALIDELSTRHVSVDVNYFDLDTVDGLTKAAYYNAFEIPVTMIFKNGQEVRRWDSEVPDLEKVRECIV